MFTHYYSNGYSYINYLLYERNRVTQLEKDLQNKDQALKSLMGEPGTPGSSPRSSSVISQSWPSFCCWKELSMIVLKIS